MQGGSSSVFAVFLFVVGAADDVVAGDVEAGIGGVECGFNGGDDVVVREEGAEEDAAATEGISHFEGGGALAYKGALVREYYGKLIIKDRQKTAREKGMA